MKWADLTALLSQVNWPAELNIASIRISVRPGRTRRGGDSQNMRIPSTAPAMASTDAGITDHVPAGVPVPEAGMMEATPGEGGDSGPAAFAATRTPGTAETPPLSASAPEDDESDSSGAANDPATAAGQRTAFVIRLRLVQESVATGAGCGDSDETSERQKNDTGHPGTAAGVPRPWPCNDGGIGLASEEAASDSAAHPGQDRVPHLAMAAVTVPPPLRPPARKRKSTLAALHPKSRIDCERRCGSDGFCDPSSELGCGGEYCGRKHDGL